MSTTTNLPTAASGTWTVEVPDEVTVTPALNPSSPTSPMTIEVAYGPESLFGPSQGTIELIFREPADGPPGGTDAIRKGPVAPHRSMSGTLSDVG